VTTECKSDSPGKRRQNWRFNPFEAALQGGSEAMRKVVAAHLEATLAADMQVCVVSPMEEHAPDGKSAHAAIGEAGAISERRHDFSNGFLPPATALDADCAIVSGSFESSIPALIVTDGTIGEKPVPNALAYVGPQSACPVLPSGLPYLAFDDHDSICETVREFFASRASATPLYGLVLTGGQSSRMGRDKASLQYHGKPQVRHLYELLTGICGEVFVSLRADQMGEAHLEGLGRIADRFVGMGPMGGILSAMHEVPEAAWLVVGCDLPFLDRPILDELLRARNPYRAATAFRGYQDLPEPLCAIYEPKSVHYLMAFLARGYQCPRKVLINSPSNVTTPANPGRLANVNHPEEYEAAVAQLSQGAAR
jgi:molybdenum cofactor guanylyltransferase